MLTIILLLLLLAACLVAVGVLCGWSWATQALEARSRHQAAVQRQINAEWHALDVARAQGGR